MLWATLLIAFGIFLSNSLVFPAYSVFLAGLPACIAIIFCLWLGRTGLAEVLRLLLTALLFVSAGVTANSFQLASQAQHVLSAPATGRIVARVQSVQLRPDECMRVTARMISTDTPAFESLSLIRVTMARHNIRAGTQITADVRLFPLSLPAFGGRPDYGCQHYMAGLSASGFVLALIGHNDADSRTAGERLHNWRTDFAARLHTAMHPQPGSIAAALLVGVRGHVSQKLYDSFRDSGLAHLLAISGLHMGLFCFSVYGGLRAVMALTPGLAQRLSVHKLAAILSILAAALYLCLSGFPVSAIRAFLMAAVVILAVLADRQAISVRNLALIAIVMILAEPSLIYTAGFQLSFLASFAIITVLDSFRRAEFPSRFIRWFSFMIVSSACASIITVPVIAYHFAHFTPWGVLANIMAIPLTGLFIMPAGIIVLIAGVTGIDSLFNLSVWLMGLPLYLLIFLTDNIAALPYAGIWMKPPAAAFIMVFAALSPVARTSNKKLAGVCLLAITAMVTVWVAQPVPVAVLLKNRQQIILAVCQAPGHFIASRPLPAFWHDHIRLVMGSGNFTSLSCRSLCKVTDAKGRHFVIVQHGSALSQACRIEADYLVTAIQPRYPCRAPQQVITAALHPAERWLIYEQNSRHHIRTNLAPMNSFTRQTGRGQRSRH